ncbi:MAG: YhgE/Pip domain-containing protein, partial [Planifilum fimeticola]
MSLKRTGGMFLALLLLVSTPVTLTMAHGAQSSGKGSYSGKSEVVYATLEADGDQKEIYVVNKFSVDRPGKIIDYGPYTRVENLTDLTEMEVDGQRVGFVTSKDLFYYQGTLKDRPLPWDIDVSYRLNGKTLPPEQLLGQDGKLEIRIHTRANEKAGENPFFENYMLQISLTLDPEIYENVEAKDGTIAEAGKNQQVTFTVMPGKEANFVVRAEVRDLEMESIQITGIPPSLSVDIPDTDGMMDGMKSLSDAVQGIDASISELNKGMAELHQGVEGLHGGSKKYKQGIRELEQGSAELIEGSESIRDALRKLSRSLGGDADQIDAGQLKELQKRLADMAGGLKQTENSLTALQDRYTKAFHALDRSMAAIPAQDISEEDIRQLKASGADPRVVEQLVQTYTAARAAKDAYTVVKGSFQAVNPTLKEVARSV